MDILYIAVVLTLISAVVFAAEFVITEPKPLRALGLSLLASGVTVWLLDILLDQGKLD